MDLMMWQIAFYVTTCLAVFVESRPQSDLNFTQTPFQVFPADPDTLHDFQKTKLTENEAIRNKIYEKYFPFFIFSGVSFVILSGVWILYNILSYTRKQKKIEKLERLHRQQESKRLLQLYHEVPVETIARS